MPSPQPVIGHAKSMGGKQLFTVTIVLKSPGFSHQPVNNVPVLDVMLAFPAQTRDRLEASLAIPYLQVLCIKPHLDLLVNEAAIHRIHVVVDPDGAARPHPDPNPLAAIKAPGRQTSQHPGLLFEPIQTPRIELFEKLAQEIDIVLTA